MADLGSINWAGFSVNKYQYWIYDISETFNAAPCNYIFARKVADGYIPVYIGQTSDISERFDNHHKMPCIKKNNATHVCVHRNDNEKDRLAEESDLINKWHPVCND